MVVGDGVGVSRSSATPPPLIPLDESVKTLLSLALKLADSTSSLSGLEKTKKKLKKLPTNIDSVKNIQHFMSQNVQIYSNICDTVQCVC